MISKSFLKSSFIYTIGGALPMAASIILLPFYSNFLDAKQFVALGFYIGISLFLQILFTYSLDTYFGVKYTQLSEDKTEQKNFVGTISILLLIIGVIVLAASFILGPFVFPLIFNDSSGVNFGTFAMASVATAFFNSYFKTGTNTLIYFKKPEQFLWFNCINFVATIGISIAGLYLFPKSLVGPISGRFFSGVIIFFLSIYIFKTNSIWKFDKKFLKDLYKFCTPYLFFVLSIWVLGNIDRYFLVSSIDSQHLAAYDQLLKCFIGIEFLQNILSAVIFPKLFEIWTKNKKHETTPESNRYFNVFTALNIVLLILFCLLIPIFIKIFIPKPEYFHSFNYIGLIAGGYASRSILNFYLSTILYSKSIKNLLMIFGVSSIVQIIITYYLVNQYGLMGAIFAGLITKVVQVVLSYLLTKNTFTYQFNYFKIYGLPVLYLAINVVCFVLFPEFNILVYISQLLLFSLFFYATFKNEIAIVYKQFFVKDKAIKW